MPRREIIRLIKYTLNWCKSTFGVNKRKQYDLEISIMKNEHPKECGEYEPIDNKIYIYWNNLDTPDEIIRTCIHEWIHYKQPILTKYFKYKGTYASHPFEKEARRQEQANTGMCWNDIKDKWINGIKN